MPEIGIFVPSESDFIASIVFLVVTRLFSHEPLFVTSSVRSSRRGSNSVTQNDCWPYFESFERVTCVQITPSYSSVTVRDVSPLNLPSGIAFAGTRLSKSDAKTAAATIKTSAFFISTLPFPVLFRSETVRRPYFKSRGRISRGGFFTKTRVREYTSRSRKTRAFRPPREAAPS